MMPVAVLAGGSAQRLGQIAVDIPKAMIDVAGRPFIHWQLEMLAEQGVGHVVLCVQYLADVIRAYVGDGRRFGINVAYSFDGVRQLGTGGALRVALPLLGPEFFVIYGDSHLDVQFSDVEKAYRDQGLPALITVLRNEDRWDKSNVLLRAGRIVAYGKSSQVEGMKHIEYGLGIVSGATLEQQPLGQRLDLATLYSDLAAERRLGCFLVSRRFYEIGSPEGLRETRLRLEGRMG